MPDLDKNVCWLIVDSGEMKNDIPKDEDLLIFVHCTNDYEWIKLDTSNLTRVHLIFMSRHGTTQESSWPANVHPCGYPTDELAGNTRIETFFRELNNGKYYWELRCPEPPRRDR